MSKALPPAAPVAPMQPWRFVYRVPLLLLWTLALVPMLLARLPGLRALGRGSDGSGAPLYSRLQRYVALALVRVLGIRLRVMGRMPEAPYLLVANHISWFDIPLLHALAPMWLVSKDGVRRWPLIGALARAVGTIFIVRGNDESRRRAARRMGALLRRGESVGMFPEGGIVARRGVGRFHARLFAPAVRAAAPVLPVAIRYWREGDVHEERVFGPGSSFLGLLISMLGRPSCEGQIIVGQVLAGAVESRSELARRAQCEVERMYGSEY